MELSELVQRIRRGDREALRALIAEYGAGVYRKAYQKTKDKDLAREATRRTFAQLVTTLQEQTDMDGWELWLNALTKRNIEACSNLRSDMVYMEGELTRELFSEPASAARLSAGNPGQPSIASFWQGEGPFAAERESAQQQAAAQYAAQQAAQQQAAAQYAAQQAAQQAAARPVQESAETQPRPEADRAPERRRKKAERLFDEQTQKPHSGTNTGVVVLLVLLCVILAWAAVGISMSLNLIPRFDLGYSWFNAHIAKFF